MGTGKRTRTLTGPLVDALGAVTHALDNLNTPGMLIGGLAVIARGVPRLTRDIDATVQGGSVSVQQMIDVLAQSELVPRINDAVPFAEVNQVLLLRHEPSGVDVDLSIAWLPFESEALAKREHLDLGGIRAPVARAEDLLIYKAVAFRPQDQQDIERLLALHGSTIDLDRVRRIVQEFSEAIEEPERPADLEALIHRAGLG